MAAFCAEPVGKALGITERKIETDHARRRVTTPARIAEQRFPVPGGGKAALAARP
jgi:hypothetical protein